MNAIDNLINGNVKDAKKQAKRIPFTQIYRAALNEHGMSQHKANATANFLKGRTSWEIYTDAVQ